MRTSHALVNGKVPARPADPRVTAAPYGAGLVSDAYRGEARARKDRSFSSPVEREVFAGRCEHAEVWRDCIDCDAPPAREDVRVVRSISLRDDNGMALMWLRDHLPAS